MFGERGIPMGDEFFRIVKEHAARYPEMEIQDYGKLAFQSEYGPEHLVTEKQSVLSFLQEEMVELPSDAAPKKIEPIGGGLCRFPLSFCKSETEVEALAELFLLTAQEYCGSAEGLLDKIAELQKFPVLQMAEWLSEWKETGYPPVRHSPRYREAYHPHYRLLKREYAGYFPAVVSVMELMKKGQPVVLSIDGRCGSGKTEFANLFSRLFDCNIFHMDDFYLPLEQRAENWREIPGGNMDLKRLMREVLEPVQKKQTVFYRPYNCQKGQMAETSGVAPKLLNIIEGSYSQHPYLRDSYQFKIFLTCSKEAQKRRLQMREGTYFTVFEEQWMPLEEYYHQCYNVEQSSDLNLDTSEFFCSERREFAL